MWDAHAVRDTMPCGIPCRAGYRAVRDTTPTGIPIQTLEWMDLPMVGSAADTTTYFVYDVVRTRSLLRATCLSAKSEQCVSAKWERAECVSAKWERSSSAGGDVALRSPAPSAHHAMRRGAALSRCA